MCPRAACSRRRRCAPTSGWPRSSGPFAASRPSICMCAPFITAPPTACGRTCSCACWLTTSNGTCGRRSSPCCSMTTIRRPPSYSAPRSLRRRSVRRGRKPKRRPSGRRTGGRYTAFRRSWPIWPRSPRIRCGPWARTRRRWMSSPLPRLCSSALSSCSASPLACSQYGAAHATTLAAMAHTYVPRARELRASQNHLCVALWLLGQRTSDAMLLDEAIAACRAALQERTREKVPLYWAATENNLGNALRSLGQQRSDAALLNEAVAAYRAALEERTRSKMPLEWATTKHNLGLALAALGQQESNPARLIEAVAAYREALLERTREKAPLDWALTQTNLGNALRILGRREPDTARLDEAKRAQDLALAVFREAGADYYVQLGERNLQRVRADLAQRTAKNHDRNAR